MRKILWPLIAVGILIWSGLAWIVHGLVGWGGNFAAGNADQVPVDPEMIELFSWLAVFGTDVAQWLVVAIWGLGVAMALGAGFLGQKLLPRLGKLGQTFKT